jgi:hypothetical protein
VDMSSTGSRLQVAASPILANTALSAAMDILDPNANRTLFDVVWAAEGGGGEGGRP